MTRLPHAIEAVRETVATVSKFKLAQILNDDDLIDDIALDELELESIALILEEIFAISIPDELWSTPLFRTPASLAEWCICRSTEAAWTESRNGHHQPRRAAGHA